MKEEEFREGEKEDERKKKARERGGKIKGGERTMEKRRGRGREKKR